MAKPNVVKLPHPKRDGTWVEFYGMSIRQLEVLGAYKVLYEFASKEFEIDKKKRNGRVRTSS